MILTHESCQVKRMCYLSAIKKVMSRRRKRLLLEDIEELHKNYNNQHPNNQIGKSKIFELRPTWVIPVQKQSQDVCKCVYHENIDLICTALVNFARSNKLKLNFGNISSADMEANSLRYLQEGLCLAKL